MYMYEAMRRDFMRWYTDVVQYLSVLKKQVKKYSGMTNREKKAFLLNMARAERIALHS